MRFNVAGLTYIQRWTKLAKECYSINCICRNCSFVPEDLKQFCRVKTYVVKSFEKFGKPERVDNEDIHL